MRTDSALASIVIVGVAAVAAFGIGIAIAGLTGAGPLASAAGVAVVITALFAWRLAEGLAAFGVVVLLSDTVEYWARVDLRFIDEVSVPLLVAVALLFHRGRLARPPIGAREAALALVFVAGAVSSVVSHVPVEVWVPAGGLLAKGFALLYLAASLRIGNTDIRRIASVLCVTFLAILGIGLVQFVAPETAREQFGLPPFDQQRGAIQVVNSLFTHPAVFGWLGAYASLFLFARFVVLREWWALAVALVFGAASLLSARRTPIVGLAAGVLVGVARQVSAGRAVARAVVPAILLGVVVVAVSVPLLSGFYGWTLTEYGESPERVAELLSESPDSARLEGMAPRNALYVASIAVARDHFPVGAGLGRFGSHMSRVTYSPLYEAYGIHQLNGLTRDDPVAVTDTFWPMVLAETGVVGLIAMVAFFVILGRDLWRTASMELTPSLRAFALGALLIFSESLVRSLISAVYVAPPIAYFVFGAAGLALASASAHDRAGTRSPAPVLGPPV